MALETERADDGGRVAGAPGTRALRGLRGAGGESWETFRRTLRPRWAAVWFDMAVRYSLLALGVIGAVLAGNGWGLLLFPAFGLWIGFWLASLVLFMHEAAHFNLHPDKKKNDRLAQWLVCILIGDEIRRYRAVHWEHHLHLGQPNDTEVSYHFAPTLRCALENLIGVHLLRVFKEHHGNRDARQDAAAVARQRFALLSGLAVHAILLVIALAAGWYGAAAAWIFGVMVCFPFFSALRNQLEHRSTEAVVGVDYTVAPHGAVNRMFASSPFARAFGSVGFRRHLLHHWDPQISYSRFDELESFLMGTEAGAEIDAARTTYFEIWRVLARQAATSRMPAQALTR